MAFHHYCSDAVYPVLTADSHQYRHAACFSLHYCVELYLKDWLASCPVPAVCNNRLCLLAPALTTFLLDIRTSGSVTSSSAVSGWCSRSSLKVCQPALLIDRRNSGLQGTHRHAIGLQA